MVTTDVFPGSSRLVEGAIPFSSILLMGPSGIGKTIFSQQFIYSGLKENEFCIYVSTDDSPDEICKSMKSFGFDVGPFLRNGAFRIVDCYSWKLDNSPGGKYIVANPSNLLSVLKVIDEARGSLKNFRLVLDSLTGLTSICEHSMLEVVRFLQVLVAKIHASESNALFIVAPEAHDPQLVSNFRLIFDGLLEMKEDESSEQIKRLFRIFSLKGVQHKTTWTPFEITSNGIVLKREDQLRCEMCSALIEWDPHVEMISGKQHVFDKPDCALTYKKLKDIYGESFE
jgi:KaiC/GvpD/RAD55 family RecA-like ATPase